MQALLDILVNAAYPPLICARLPLEYLLAGSLPEAIAIFNYWPNSRIIVVQLMSSRTFTQPPYNWELGELGLLSLAGFIGSILAFYVSGCLIDIISTRSTARYRKPEYRLPAIVIPGVVGPAGILIFGLCIANKTHWIGPAVGNALQAFSVAAISNVAVTYSLDSYKPVCTVEIVSLGIFIDDKIGCW